VPPHRRHWAAGLVEFRVMEKPAGLSSAGFALSRGLGRVSAIGPSVAT
jgi:hypothetical protein